MRIAATPRAVAFDVDGTLAGSVELRFIPGGRPAVLDAGGGAGHALRKLVAKM